MIYALYLRLDCQSYFLYEVWRGSESWSGIYHRNDLIQNCNSGIINPNTRISIKVILHLRNDVLTMFCCFTYHWLIIFCCFTYHWLIIFCCFTYHWLIIFCCFTYHWLIIFCCFTYHWLIIFCCFTYHWLIIFCCFTYHWLIIFCCFTYHWLIIFCCFTYHWLIIFCCFTYHWLFIFCCFTYHWKILHPLGHKGLRQDARSTIIPIMNNGTVRFARPFCNICFYLHLLRYLSFLWVNLSHAADLIYRCLYLVILWAVKSLDFMYN
jgi:hypothetical protein